MSGMEESKYVHPQDRDWSRMFNHPKHERTLEFQAKKALEFANLPPEIVPTPQEKAAYFLRKKHGLYDDDDINDLNGFDVSNWEARKIAVAASLFLVGISRSTDGYYPLTSSGIVFEHNGIRKIITSTYILGSSSRDPISSCNTNVDVFLPNRKKVCGSICLLDEHHNVMIIHADLHEDPKLRAATFDTKPLALGTVVTAISRNSSSQLRASIGQINIRSDHLESDELLSSSCSISECGIGGPLVSSSGLVVGLNIFGRKGFTPFMPSIIIKSCMKMLMDHGKVIRPCLGLKTRSLNESKAIDLDLFLKKFNSMTGIVVTGVTEQSAADLSGIHVGDVIVSCNGRPVNSPAELADILIKMVEFPTCGGGSCVSKRRRKSVEVVIQRLSTGRTETKLIVLPHSYPTINNRWPLLPDSTSSTTIC